MHGLFKTLGVLLAVYTLYAVWRGEVYARRRAWGESITRSERPQWFWTVIAIYAALSVALLTIF